MEPLSKARIKFIQSLQHKKFRLKYDKFIVEGLKITTELIRERKHIIEEVYISNPDYHPLLSNSINTELLSLITPQQMHQLSQMTTPPGVLAVCKLPEAHHLPASLKGLRIYYLDAIRDPGNLGTILRIADWFGLDYVAYSPDSVDIYNHKVLQSSMGSALRVKSVELSKEELVHIENTDLYICDTKGQSIYALQPPPDGIIVFGNESLGVSEEIIAKAQKFIAIPGDHSLGAESLNVASAAAIIASWWRIG
jgi:TrmH family RNA methyltransferase